MTLTAAWNCSWQSGSGLSFLVPIPSCFELWGPTLERICKNKPLCQQASRVHQGTHLRKPLIHFPEEQNKLFRRPSEIPGRSETVAEETPFPTPRQHGCGRGGWRGTRWVGSEAGGKGSQCPSRYTFPTPRYVNGHAKRSQGGGTVSHPGPRTLARASQAARHSPRRAHCPDTWVSPQAGGFLLTSRAQSGRDLDAEQGGKFKPMIEPVSDSASIPQPLSEVLSRLCKYSLVVPLPIRRGESRTFRPGRKRLLADIVK